MLLRTLEHWELPFEWNEARVGLSVVKMWIISEREQFGLTAGVGQSLGGGRSNKIVRFVWEISLLFLCVP
jgi:hypothetical protein